MNVALTGLHESAQAKLNEVKGLLAKAGGPSAEEVTRIQALNGEIEGIKGQITTLQDASSKSAQYDAWLNQPATHLPQGRGAPGADVLGHAPAGEAQITPKGAGSVLEQYGPGILTEAQFKAIRDPEYKRAFDSYLRKGEKGLRSAEIKVLQEGIDDQGGFLAPEEILNRVIMKRPTPTRVREYVTALNTSRDQMVLPKVNYASAGDDSTGNLYTTGVRATWTGEIPASATTHRVTEPVFGQFRVQIFTAMMSMPLTNNMVEDAAIDITGWASDRFRETIELLEDNMILNGTGVDQPAGILQNPNGTNEPATVVSGSASALTADGLISLACAVPEQYEDALQFVFNKTNTFLAIRQLKDSQNRYLFGLGYQDSGLVATLRPADLLGYPFRYSGFMPNIGSNTYPVIFGDYAGYYLVRRIGFSIQVLRELYAETNQVLLLGRIRFGGDVGEDWRLKIQKVST